MPTTIRAEIEVGMPGDCPVARASAVTESTIDGVTRSSGRDASGHVTEEFTIENGYRSEDESVSAGEGEDEITHDPSADTALAGSEPVFDLETHTVYRFTRDPGTECVCECIERFGWPVSNVRANDGALVVSCYASDVKSLTAVVSELREAFDDIRVRQLVQSGGETDGDLLVVDRSWVTDRQREVLETAHEMGYSTIRRGRTRARSRRRLVSRGRRSASISRPHSGSCWMRCWPIDRLLLAPTRFDGLEVASFDLPSAFSSVHWTPAIRGDRDGDQ